jgi:hypothetical protein
MTQVNSTIRFSLRENKLQVPNAPAYVAQVRGYKTVTQAQLVNIMANANTTVSRQDIIVVLDLLENAVKEQLLNGNNVVTNLFTSRVSIKGGFEALNAEYEKGVHKVKVNMSASAELKKYVDHNAITEKVRAGLRMPAVDTIYDFTTDTLNTVVSPGRMAELKGYNLLLNGTDPAEGIYFLREGTKEEVKVDVINRRTSGTVLFTTPEGLPAGNYKVTFKAWFGEELREGKLQKTIAVN